jgi:hypothetical protein
MKRLNFLPQARKIVFFFRQQFMYVSHGFLAVFCCPGGWTGKGYQPIYFRSSGKISDLSQTPCPSRLSAVIASK